MSVKNLTEWLDYISLVHPSEMEFGLERIRSVFESLSISNSAKKCIVVGGTNGKGSTVSLIERGLNDLGYTVGSYTSPHIQAYNERVKINQKLVSDQQLVDAFERIELYRSNVPLTYFEYGTLAALDILFAANLDVIILEVGLGGRLDAVNIIDADISVITSIAIDHVDWLGSDVQKIGIEKAGILRESRTFVAGRDLPKSVLDIAGSLNCNVKQCGKEFGCSQGANESISDFWIQFRGDEVSSTQFPSITIPDNNILIALQVIAEVNAGFSTAHQARFPFEKLKKSFENINIPGRLEKIPHRHSVYLDVCHNPHAAEYLNSFLSPFVKQGCSILAVYSSMVDKDVTSIASLMSASIDTWYLAPLSIQRASSLSQLKTAVGEHCDSMLSFSSVRDAISRALSECDKRATGSTVVIIFGSFFMVEAAKHYFEGL